MPKRKRSARDALAEPSSSNDLFRKEERAAYRMLNREVAAIPARPNESPLKARRTNGAQKFGATRLMNKKQRIKLLQRMGPHENLHSAHESKIVVVLSRSFRSFAIVPNAASDENLQTPSGATRLRG